MSFRGFYCSGVWLCEDDLDFFFFIVVLCGCVEFRGFDWGAFEFILFAWR